MGILCFVLPPPCCAGRTGTASLAWAAAAATARWWRRGAASISWTPVLCSRRWTVTRSWGCWWRRRSIIGPRAAMWRGWSKEDSSLPGGKMPWIGFCKVHSYYNFGPLSLCLSVNYLDRFLSTFNLPLDKSWMQQLMSVACLSLAVKMEETVVPLPVDLQVFEADYMFEARNIKRMELIVMETLNWRMNAVTPFSFMCYFLGKFNEGKTPSYMLASRCAELIVATVKDYRFLSFRPSEIAAAVALSALAETQAIGFSSALAASEIPVNKEMIVRCYELLVKKRGNLGASLPAPQSPIAVLDAACFSFRSDDITPGSSPLSNNGGNNDQASTPASKRRRLSTSPI